jgi:type IV pilus assembly protein PilO
MKIDIEEIKETLQSLDPENIGSWPTYVKSAIYVLVFIVVFVAGNYFLVADMRTKLISSKNKEASLLKAFEDKSFKAANLEEFKKQMDDLDGSYAALLRQLPRGTEVPGLLEDITNVGLGSGLKIDRIKPGNEEEVEFYVVLPIDLEVRGGFHGLAGFMSGVSALPRIVTLHDFTIEAEQTDSRALGTKLKMVIKAKTYRYQDEES